MILSKKQRRMVAKSTQMKDNLLKQSLNNLIIRDFVHIEPEK